MEGYIKRVEERVTKYKTWVEGLTKGVLEEGEVGYKDTKGEEKRIVIREALTHVNNHHTHHLGQLSAAYREYTGKDDFVEIDYLYYKE